MSSDLTSSGEVHPPVEEWKECMGISDFLHRIVVQDGDCGIVQGLNVCLQDVDDCGRIIPFVRFRCSSAEELAFHVEELKLGNPYKRRLVREEMMVQETYDFFTLLQQMRHEMPRFIKISPLLERMIKESIGMYPEEEGDGESEEEEEASYTSSPSSSESESGSSEEEEEEEEDAVEVSSRGKKKRKTWTSPPSDEY